MNINNFSPDDDNSDNESNESNNKSGRPNHKQGRVPRILMDRPMSVSGFRLPRSKEAHVRGFLMGKRINTPTRTVITSNNELKNNSDDESDESNESNESDDENAIIRRQNSDSDSDDENEERKNLQNMYYNYHTPKRYSAREEINNTNTSIPTPVQNDTHISLGLRYIAPMVSISEQVNQNDNAFFIISNEEFNTLGIDKPEEISETPNNETPNEIPDEEQIEHANQSNIRIVNRQDVITPYLSNNSQNGNSGGVITVDDDFYSNPNVNQNSNSDLSSNNNDDQDNESDYENDDLIVREDLHSSSSDSEDDLPPLSVTSDPTDVFVPHSSNQRIHNPYYSPPGIDPMRFRSLSGFNSSNNNHGMPSFNFSSNEKMTFDFEIHKYTDLFEWINIYKGASISFETKNGKSTAFGAGATKQVYQQIAMDLIGDVWTKTSNYFVEPNLNNCFWSDHDNIYALVMFIGMIVQSGSVLPYHLSPGLLEKIVNKKMSLIDLKFFLEKIDPDVYGSVKKIETNHVPFESLDTGFNDLESYLRAILVSDQEKFIHTYEQIAGNFELFDSMFDYDIQLMDKVLSGSYEITHDAVFNIINFNSVKRYDMWKEFVYNLTESELKQMLLTFGNSLTLNTTYNVYLSWSTEVDIRIATCIKSITIHKRLFANKETLDGLRNYFTGTDQIHDRYSVSFNDFDNFFDASPPVFRRNNVFEFLDVTRHIPQPRNTSTNRYAMEPIETPDSEPIGLQSSLSVSINPYNIPARNRPLHSSLSQPAVTGYEQRRAIRSMENTATGYANMYGMFGGYNTEDSLIMSNNAMDSGSFGRQIEGQIVGHGIRLEQSTDSPTWQTNPWGQQIEPTYHTNLIFHSHGTGMTLTSIGTYYSTLVEFDFDGEFNNYPIRIEPPPLPNPILAQMEIKRAMIQKAKRKQQKQISYRNRRIVSRNNLIKQNRMVMNPKFPRKQKNHFSTRRR